MVGQNNVSHYTKPKRKVLKIVLFSLLIIILGIGIWFGASIYNTLKKITSFSSGGSILSMFDSSRQKLKGESEGRTNILLLGMGGKNHPGGTLSDTMIVLSLDWKTKKVAMISIPRDLYVPIPDYGSGKINNAYAHGEKNPTTTGGGGQLASDTVSKVLDIPIHYFIKIDFEGFKKIVDEVGGIDVTVDKDLYDPLYPAANMIDYDPFKITAGEHHLDGSTALKYARSRETTSDFDRSKRQQKVILATKEKLVTLNVLGNPKKISDLLSILGDHIRTSLSINEMKSLYDSIKDFDTQNMINHVFDTAADGPLTSVNDSRGYIIIPKKGVGKFIDMQTIVKNIFDTETKTDLSIEVQNGSGKSGAAKDAADVLKGLGYTSITVGDASKTYPKSIVYNCSGSKSTEVAASIAKKLFSSVETKTSCGAIDIQVIIGQNYSLAR